MQVKVYLVIEVTRPGCEKVVAVRLNNTSAREIAKLKANRTVKMMVATKSKELSFKEETKQQQGGMQHGKIESTNPRENG